MALTKNLQILLNSLIIIFLTSFYSCVSSQTKQNESNKINFNWIVDNYIDFYSKKDGKFNLAEKYIMMSVSEDIDKQQTYIYLNDNCYKCPGVETNDYLILLYKGYRIVIATDNSKNREIILKNLKKTLIGTHFKVTPYSNNATYDYPHQWEIKYDDNGKLIFFCNGVLTELEETKNKLHLESSVEDCNPLQNSIQMRNKLTLLFLTFMFQLAFTQIPYIPKNYTFDNFIEAFINANNDENFKPDISIMHISSFYYTDKGYMITITRDNIESIMVNPKSPNLEYFKYNGLDLLLQGNTSKDITFLKKIIKKKSISNSSKIKFKEPYDNVSYNPYQWFLLFDKKMNLINYTLPEDKDKISELFKDFNIKTTN